MSALAIGYLLPTEDAAGAHGQRISELIELGVRAEGLGFEAVWVPDSPFQYGLPEPLLVLAALAARTRRITLATGVYSRGCGSRRCWHSSLRASTPSPKGDYAPGSAPVLIACQRAPVRRGRGAVRNPHQSARGERLADARAVVGPR